ncbi:uncharacterized protein LOC103367567 [Stegastes partitus]|uniref:Uncharacterized protein LOC103367567 n=1 Tax=Stegastes partitus TaxID=144197 RepID=A0A9Y4KHK7_9TELE|nr:PREDICTED: uncharacterized protein LOC103367567 [Stegastes partitus]
MNQFQLLLQSCSVVSTGLFLLFVFDLYREETPREVLHQILEDLAEEEFKTFKWFLNQEILKPFKAIPKSRLEKADRTDTVDEMFKSCCIYTMRVAAKGLEKIPRNDLVQNIPKTIKEPEEILTECRDNLKSALKEKFQLMFEDKPSWMRSTQSCTSQRDGLQRSMRNMRSDRLKQHPGEQPEQKQASNQKTSSEAQQEVMKQPEQ